MKRNESASHEIKDLSFKTRKRNKRGQFEIVSYPYHWKTLSQYEPKHKCCTSLDPSRHFRVSLLVKSSISLTSSSNKQCGVSLWLSQVEIFLLSEQASEKLARYSNKTTSSFEKWMPSAAQHYWIAQDNHEKKIFFNVSKPNHFIRFLFLSLSFFQQKVNV